MIAGIKEFVRMAKEDKLTTLCAIVFGVTSLIVAQPGVIAFLDPASSLLVVQISEFIQKAAVVVGLAFAAQSKPQNSRDLSVKDVIPEVLVENQPEGKEELQNPAPKKPRKAIPKVAPKKAVSKPKCKPKTKSKKNL